MGEDQNKKKAQISEQPLAEEVQKQILEDNKKWLESDGKDGKKADFGEAYLNEASLILTNLQNANLQNANLKDAEFLGTDRRRANLKKANPKGAILISANLANCLNLTQEQLNSACGNEKTKLPPGLTIKECPKKE